MKFFEKEINIENDSTIHRDFEKVFERRVPEDLSYGHTLEGKLRK